MNTNPSENRENLSPIGMDIQTDFEQYWDARYNDNTAHWDLKQVSPPIKSYLDQVIDKNISILIPGAGNAYEAKYLLELGFTNITVVDIAPTIIENLRQGFEKNANIKIIHADFFKHHGDYDLILEQTFFCALPPALRKDYVHKMYTLLNDGGKLVGLLFNKNFEINPPFGGNELEYRQLFSNVFEIKIMEPCTNSVAPRQGTELFFHFVKK